MGNNKIAWLLAFIVSICSSCFKDDCRRQYTVYTPQFRKLSSLRAEVASGLPSSIEKAGKIFIKGTWIFLNEPGEGIHVIDNSQPKKPVQYAFIKIPGNVDLYVKGNTLYADLFCDLMAIDITDPRHIQVSKYLTKMFPEKVLYSNTTNADSIDVITGWSKKDTVVDCTSSQILTGCANCQVFFASSSTAQSASPAGVAGSMARFAANGDYLYTVTKSNLGIVNISKYSDPVYIKSKPIGWDVETIFPYNNKLYIGAGSSMSVFDLQDPVNPQQLSWSGHWCSHDPVVADDKYAYVTLHASNVCGDKVNQLEIYDLSTPNAPRLVKTQLMDGPLGLSKDGNLLFICDGNAGLKIFDVSDVSNLKQVGQIAVTGTYDVIAMNGIVYLVSSKGLTQYDYSDINNIRFLSKL